MNDTEQHKLRSQGRLGRLQLPYLLARFKPRYIWALFMFVNGLITIGILSALALLTGSSLVFPSLGPTAIVFFLTPTSVAARPLNALIGHGIGILCGYAALLLTGLTNAPSVMSSDITVPRIIAASLALATTGAVMALISRPHAPAGATTLIIALGFITKPSDVLVIEVAVCLLVLQAVVINRLARVSLPKNYK